MKLFLRDDIARAWSGRDAFECVAAIEGDVYRNREGRRTLRFSQNGREYFLKHHRGVGWKEIAKNLTQAKKPVLGAAQEYAAIERLHEAGIDTLSVAAFGERGLDPSCRESFLITDSLTGTISLEDLFEGLAQTRPDARMRRALLRGVASIARRMHDAGVNHRDFYLCHFLMNESAVSAGDPTAALHLIDLHRSQVRRRVPSRWRVKDLGGLYFSGARCGFSRRDLYRFVEEYAGRPWHEELRRNGGFWQRVRREGDKIYRRYYEKEPAFPLGFSEHPGKDI